MTRNTLIKSVGIALSIGLLAASAVAAANGWATPTGIFAGNSDGSVRLTGMPNAEGCRNAGIVFRQGYADPDSIQRLATTAMVHGKKLFCFSDGCDGADQRGTSCAMHLDDNIR